MFECRWMLEVERLCDGEHPNPESVRAHMASCASCAKHAETILRMRSAASSTFKRAEIAEPQFDAFLHSVRERVEARPSRWGGLWAVLSLTAAAMIVAVAAIIIFDKGPEKVEATVVESVSSDIRGAKVGTYSTDNGVTTVWLKIPAAKDDIL
jgi:anti-sigma factor RsiW